MAGIPERGSITLQIVARGAARPNARQPDLYAHHPTAPGAKMAQKGHFQLDPSSTDPEYNGRAIQLGVPVYICDGVVYKSRSAWLASLHPRPLPPQARFGTPLPAAPALGPDAAREARNRLRAARAAGAGMGGAPVTNDYPHRAPSWSLSTFAGEETEEGRP
jgi:hypothetical protein